MDELKRCPFCGGQAVICAPIEGIVGYVIRCEAANCCEMTSSDNSDQIMARWNQRYPTTQSSGREKAKYDPDYFDGMIPKDSDSCK